MLIEKTMLQTAEKVQVCDATMFNQRSNARLKNITASSALCIGCSKVVCLAFQNG
jgi:hypothetical protein